jgi:type I restriction-modification system DNA methylase subunit
MEVEIVDVVTRLAAVNLLLHGVGPTANEAEPPVKTDDSLRSDPNDRFDLVLTNPPFGKKSSVMVVNDFWLKDDSLEDSANLEDPDVIAAEIVEDLRAALEEFELILGDLSS